MKKLFLGLLLAIVSFGAVADNLDIVVPFSVGGNTDRLGRDASAILNEAHMSNAVINKPGVAGLLGFKEFLKSNPDTTLVSVGKGLMVYSAKKFPKMGIQPIDNVQFVSPIYRSPEVIVTKAGSNITLADLFDPSKPARTFHVSVGGAGHEYFTRMLNKYSHNKFVPLLQKGSGNALTSVLNGDADLFIDAYAFMVPHKTKLKILGVAQKNPTVDVPSFTNKIGDTEFYQWLAICASPKMDSAIAANLRKVLSNVTGERKELWVSNGWEVANVPSDEWLEFVKAQIK